MDAKTGPKTVEELYREHVGRVVRGQKEEWSAWQFAKAVGVILDGPQGCIQSFDCNAGDHSDACPSSK
jgi:hypothetical protein